MNSKIKFYLLVILAVVTGYLMMAFLQTVNQEWIFGGVSLTKSPPWVLLIAGIGTIFRATLAGYIATLIPGKNTLVPNIIMCALVVLETTWIIRAGLSIDPRWFDAPGGATLLIGIMLGGFLRLKQNRMNVTSH